MQSAMGPLEPKEVWKHFDAFTDIPRASTKEAAAREYVLGQKHAKPAPASRHPDQWVEYCHSRNVLHPVVPLWSGTAVGSG